MRQVGARGESVLDPLNRRSRYPWTMVRRGNWARYCAAYFSRREVPEPWAFAEAGQHGAVSRAPIVEAFRPGRLYGADERRSLVATGAVDGCRAVVLCPAVSHFGPGGRLSGSQRHIDVEYGPFADAGAYANRMQMSDYIQQLALPTVSWNSRQGAKSYPRSKGCAMSVGVQVFAAPFGVDFRGGFDPVTFLTSFGGLYSRSCKETLGSENTQ